MSLDEARLLANVNERAQSLFENGYRARWTNDSIVEVTTPKKRVYEVDTDKHTCTCPFFVSHEGRYGCKHLIGYLLLLMRIQQQRVHTLLGCLNPKYRPLWPEWLRATNDGEVLAS